MADEATDPMILAEEAIAGAQKRADMAESTTVEHRVRLNDTQVKLTDAQAELAAAIDRADGSDAELEAAKIAQSEAEADAAELRQAEAARAGQGRWARIRLAWRG